MTDASEAVAAPATAPAAQAARKRLRFSWKLIVPLALLIVAGGGSAAYFLMFAGPPSTSGPTQAEAPLPTYLDIKPFVVSMRGADDAPHFVQFGINLMLTGAALSPLINAVEPEVDDAIRLSALQFKVEEIETPSGVDKMRAAILANVNRVLLQRLGAERIEKQAGGSKDAVKTLYFTQLVVE